MKRILKFLLFVLISLLILGLLITVIMPSEGQIERDGVINAPREVVFNTLNDLQSYAAWNPWVQSASRQRIILSRPASGTGAFASWQTISGTKQMNGRYEITSSHPDSALHYRMELQGIPPLEGVFRLSSSADGKATGIHWHMNLRAGWKPWWRFYAAIIDRIAGPQLETGLTQLKTICESGPDVQQP